MLNEDDYVDQQLQGSSVRPRDKATELSIEGEPEDCSATLTPTPWSSIVGVLWTPEGRCVTGDNLVTLRITGCQLDMVGREIGSLKHLESLDLSNNALCGLPDELFLLLPQLRFLNLNNNRLEVLSSKVGRLLCLEELRVARNRLRSLPFDALLCPPGLHLVDTEANLIDTQSLTREQLHFACSVCSGLWQQCTPNRVRGGGRTAHLDSRVRLFIGSIESTWDLSELKRLKVTHILSIGVQPAEPLLSSGEFSRLFVDLPDLPTEDLLSKLSDGAALRFIDSSQGGGCLIHCMAGVSRSAAFALAWIMSREQMRLEEALNLLKRARPCVQPNWGFQAQLALLLDYPRFLMMDGSMSPNPSGGGFLEGRGIINSSSPLPPTGPSSITATPTSSFCPSVFSALTPTPADL